MAYISRHPEVIHLDEREKYDVRHVFLAKFVAERIALM